MQKTLSLLAAFFAAILLREKQKKPFVSPMFFEYIILKNEEKTSKKNTEKCFPIHLQLTCQKLGKSAQKEKFNSPKFNIDWLRPQPFNYYRLIYLCLCDTPCINGFFLPVVVVDMDDIDSVTMAGTWKQDIVNNAVFTANNGNLKENIAESKLIPILLLGNKMDKVD